MTLPPGLLRDFLRREYCPFAEISLEHAEADPVAWEGALSEIKNRRDAGLPVSKLLADFACDVATERVPKPPSKNRAGKAWRNWKIRTAVQILMRSGLLSERAAQRYVGSELGLSYEAVASVCRSA